MKISGNKLLGKRCHKPAIAAMVLGALVSFQAGAARAEFNRLRRVDFLGAAQTANSNERFNPRIRQLYATVDQDDFGAHLLAGQAWTLATMNVVGIVPRTEYTPLVIDDQYVPGFTWARQPQIRVTKDFDQTLWFARPFRLALDLSTTMMRLRAAASAARSSCRLFQRCWRCNSPA